MPFDHLRAVWPAWRILLMLFFVVSCFVFRTFEIVEN